jgi:hypothetical protein
LGLTKAVKGLSVGLAVFASCILVGCIGTTQYREIVTVNSCCSNNVGDKLVEHRQVWTKKDVERELGKPTRMVAPTKYNLEAWVYEADVAWRGTIIWVFLLPLPFVVPAGHNEVTAYFSGEVLEGVRAEATRKDHQAPLCGFAC